jgi:hypothetical protein
LSTPRAGYFMRFGWDGYAVGFLYDFTSSRIYMERAGGFVLVLGYLERLGAHMGWAAFPMVFMFIYFPPPYWDCGNFGAERFMLLYQMYIVCFYYCLCPSLVICDLGVGDAWIRSEIYLLAPLFHCYK